MVPLARHLGGGSPASIRSEGMRRDPPSAAGWGRWAWAGEGHGGESQEGLAPSSPLHLLAEVSRPPSPLTPTPSLARGPSTGRPVLASLGPQLQVRTQSSGMMLPGASAPGPPAAWRESGKQLPKAAFGPGPLFSLLANLAPMCCLTSKGLASVCLLQSAAWPRPEQTKPRGAGFWPSSPPLSAALAFVGFQTVLLNLSQKIQLLPL